MPERTQVKSWRIGIGFHYFVIGGAQSVLIAGLTISCILPIKLVIFFSEEGIFAVKKIDLLIWFDIEIILS